METTQPSQSCLVISFENEQWKDIVGYEGKYSVSNFGRLKNRKKIRNPVLRKDGYYHANFRKNGKGQMLLLHRVMANAFLGGLNEALEVNHKNGLRHDNRLENLEIVTRSQNMKHRASDLGYTVRGVDNPRCTLSEATVLEIRDKYKNGGIAIHELVKLYDRSHSCIFSIVKYRTWKHLM